MPISRAAPSTSKSIRCPAVGTTRPSRSTTLTVTSATSVPSARIFARSTVRRTAAPSPVVATVSEATHSPRL